MTAHEKTRLIGGLFWEKKWGFNTTEKYEISRKNIRKQNCIISNRFDFIVIWQIWFKQEIKQRLHLYMGTLQNYKLHLKPGFLLRSHIWCWSFLQGIILIKIVCALMLWWYTYVGYELTLITDTGTTLRQDLIYIQICTIPRRYTVVMLATVSLHKPKHISKQISSEHSKQVVCRRQLINMCSVSGNVWHLMWICW